MLVLFVVVFSFAVHQELQESVHRAEGALFTVATSFGARDDCVERWKSGAIADASDALGVSLPSTLAVMSGVLARDLCDRQGRLSNGWRGQLMLANGTFVGGTLADGDVGMENNCQFGRCKVVRKVIS